MPKRVDIKRILIIGAGPIIIGQACEFDYSGVQACRALKDEGYKIILINSNPATIMTDPNMADVIYIEPITTEVISCIIKKENPDAILPTMGGQTALNCALDLHNNGILNKYKIELIGISPESIEIAENREKFKKLLYKVGLNSAKSNTAHSIDDAIKIHNEIALLTGTNGFPIIIRPSFTLGGSGGGIAYNKKEFIDICLSGLNLSPIKELLIEESLIGWKEYELEVIRDRKGNFIVVCAIENIDPMGIHTGDSITVTPIQTLTDKEYQVLRNSAISILLEAGINSGCANVQFAINPKNGYMVVVEMNPRVSRSSALASKATGFPIAKISSKLAVGYTLDELSNEITDCKTPALFEPTIDYVVIKMPRFTFEKFIEEDVSLTTQMKSVGEIMAIGRTFQESLQKAIRSLEIGYNGLNEKTLVPNDIIKEICKASPDRIWYIGDAFRIGMTVQDIFEKTLIDPWFLSQIEQIIIKEKILKRYALENISKEEMLFIKQSGFSDSRLAVLLNTTEYNIRSRRIKLNVHPVYKRIDTCAAEFSTNTAYMYSTYDEECESSPTNKKKIIVLGGGPNRIGQGIEFDYCCVHAILAIKEEGYEAIMINCNPETVSTDYDISDRLYFDPITLEDILEIIRKESPFGVIVQYGGQTPLKLAAALKENGVNIIGTQPDMIDIAENREKFHKLINTLNLRQPENRIAYTKQEALNFAEEIGYPIIVRPSYVLGGRAMEIIHDSRNFNFYINKELEMYNTYPILLDSFLNDAIECDIDCISDGKEVFITEVMEHIEQAGIHSGDSTCSIPPYSLSKDVISELKRQTIEIAISLNIIGLMNIQFAIQNSIEKNCINNKIIFVLEVNPRASRTIPYISKALGIPLAKIAARIIIGKNINEQRIKMRNIPLYFSVKKAIFPFAKFPAVDPLLGPEMRSTGEVMGIGKTFGEAIFKSQLAAGFPLPKFGSILLTVMDRDKIKIIKIAHELHDLGYKLIATLGTAKVINDAKIPVKIVDKAQNNCFHIIEMIKNREISLIFTTIDETQKEISDSRAIRMSAQLYKVTYYTTMSGILSALEGLKYLKNMKNYSLQKLCSYLN